MKKRSDILLKDIGSEGKHDFGNQIAELVHAHFDRKLPNIKGKPQLGREWTVLAAVVVENVLDISDKETDVSLIRNGVFTVSGSPVKAG